MSYDKIQVTHDMYSYMYEYTKLNGKMPEFKNIKYDSLDLESYFKLSALRTSYQKDTRPLYVLNDFSPNRDLQIMYTLCLLSAQDNKLILKHYLSCCLLDVFRMLGSSNMFDVMKVLVPSIAAIYSSTSSSYDAFYYEMKKQFELLSSSPCIVDNGGLLICRNEIIACNQYQEFRLHNCSKIIKAVTDRVAVDYSNYLLDSRIKDDFEFFDGDLYGKRLLGYGYRRQASEYNIFKLCHVYVNKHLEK